MLNSTSTYRGESADPQIEITQGARGWIAKLRDRNLAARGKTEDEAVERVRATADLVDHLAKRWTGTDAENARG